MCRSSAAGFKKSLPRLGLEFCGKGESSATTPPETGGFQLRDYPVDPVDDGLIEASEGYTALKQVSGQSQTTTQPTQVCVEGVRL